MRIQASTSAEYIRGVDELRRPAFEKLLEAIQENIPDGFQEGTGEGFIAFYVPHSVYPGGYHCNPKQPLPFVGIAAQKHFLALYHMGIYVNHELLNWFVTEYPKHSKGKLDMGKSCVRFKKTSDIPYQLIGQLMQKMTVEQWIELYESVLKR